MNAYTAFALKSFNNNLAYRSEVWLRTVGNFVAILIQVTIWKAVMSHNTTAGVSIQDMITYSIINTVLLSILMTNVYNSVDESLRSGSIAIQLIKPLSYPLYLFSEQSGAAFYQFIFTVIPTVLISWAFFGISAPHSAYHFMAFTCSLLIALIISFALGYLIALIAFWYLTMMALEWTLIGLMTVFSGSFLPIWFFPPVWASIASALPFQFTGYIPAALYTGRIPAEDILPTLGLGLMWVVLLFGVIRLLWYRAVKRLVIQGG